MENLKARLIAEVQKIEGVEELPSPVAGGSSLFFRGREFAHFHHDQELDLRLTRKLIEAEGLLHPQDSKQHPGRAAGSPWIELRFHDLEDVSKVARLVHLAVGAL